MKTLLVTLEYPPQIGGIASHSLNLAAHLPADEIVVYAPKIAGDVAYDGRHSWKVYRLKPYLPFFWPRWLRLYWQVRQIVKKEKIERLLIQHALPAGYVGYLLKKFRRIPYVVFFHGTDLEVGLKKKLRKISLVCRAAEKVVVSSEFLKNKLLAKLDDLKNVVVVHPCPGDLFFDQPLAEEIARLRSQLALAGKKVVITVGRVADGKGFPHIIRLLSKILKKVPNLVWLVIGSGPKIEEVSAMARKNNLQNVVRFLGQIEYEFLPAYYHLADLFVLLSHRDETSEEGWGTVFLEAAACGLPVVAGRVGGAEEAVENLVSGVLVDVYQEESVISAIADLLREEEYAKKMGQAGAERARRDFRWEKQIGKI